MIDSEVRKLVYQCHAETTELLMSKKDLMESLAKRLLEKEVINLPDIIQTLGERPFPMKETLKDYLNEMTKRDLEEEEEKAGEGNSESDESHKIEESENSETDEEPKDKKEKSGDEEETEKEEKSEKKDKKE